MISFLICRLDRNYRRCSKCVPCTWLHSLHRCAIVCRTLAKIPGLCLIWSNAVNIRSISSCLVKTGLMYTTLFTWAQRKKNLGVLDRATLLATQQVPLSLSISTRRLCSEVLLLAGWSALGRHHVGTTFHCISQGISPPWAAEVCSGGIPGKLPHSNGLEWWQVLADNLQEFHRRYVRWISPGELWWTLRADSRRPRYGCFCCWISHRLWSRHHQ